MKRALVLLITSLALAACGGATRPTAVPTPRPTLVSVSTQPAAAAASATAVPATATSILTATPIPPTATSAPTPTTAAPTNTATTAHLGDVAQGGGYFIVGTAIEDPSTPGSLYQPESGKKVVGVELVIGNVSGEAIMVNPYNGTLVDSDGFTYRPELGGRDRGQLDMVTLNQGERVKGWIAFQVPDTAKPKSVKYDVSWGDTLVAGLTPPGAGQAQVPLPARTGPKLPKLGEAVERDGYSLSAWQVEDPAKPSSYFETYYAEKGMRLIAIELVIGNVSGAQIAVNPLDATLVDTDGFLYRPSLGASDEGQIDMTDLNPGEKAKGWIAFQVPAQAKLEGVKYDMSSEVSLVTGLTK